MENPNILLAISVIAIDDRYKEHQNYADSACGGKEHGDNVGDEHHHANDERFVCKD